MERQSYSSTHDQITPGQSCIQRTQRQTTILQRDCLTHARHGDFNVFSMKSLFWGFQVLFCLLVSVRPVYAYLDTGTVSFLLQALLGSIAVALASLSLFWQRIRDYFSSLKKTNEPDVSSKEAKEPEETD